MTTYAQMLDTASARLAAIGGAVSRRRNYYRGQHPAQFTSESWNASFRERMRGLVDNQVRLVIDHRAATVYPLGWNADQDSTPAGVAAAADAAWVSARVEDQGETLAEAIRTARWSQAPTTLLVDYALDGSGEVVLQLANPDACHVERGRDGSYLWLVHYWEEEGLTHATVQVAGSAALGVRARVAHFASRDAHLLVPASGDFYLVEERDYPWTELMAVSLSDRACLTDRIAPLNDALNKSLQQQAVAGEAYVLPLRVWLNLDYHDEETGEEKPLPDMNPATGGRDLILDGGTDPTTGETKVIQFQSPEPEKFLKEQDSHRMAIARQGSMPAHLLQLGSTPVSGQAMENASQATVEVATDDRRTFRPPLERLARLMLLRRDYAETGVVRTDLPRLRVGFDTSGMSTTSSRLDQVRTAVQAGMTLRDALVTFLGMTAEAADSIVERADLERELASERTAQAFDAGTLVA